MRIGLFTDSLERLSLDEVLEAVREESDAYAVAGHGQSPPTASGEASSTRACGDTEPPRRGESGEARAGRVSPAQADRMPRARPG